MFTYSKLSWRYWGIVLVLVALAAGLRLYKIGDVPHGMTWDEAAIGYNGFAIVHARRDEWLQFLPVSFRSFGDYKAPLAIYANGIFTTVLGLELWAVRLPFVLSGIMTVLGFILLLKELLPKDNRYAPLLTIIGGFMLAVSPWHIHFSRVGFESGIALGFVVWGMWGIYRYLNTAVPSRWYHVGWLLLSVILWVAAIYTYHSSKMVVPLLGFYLAVTYWHRWRKILLQLAVVGVIGAVLLVPFVNDTLKGEGSTRFTQASIFGLSLTASEMVSSLINNTLIHLQPGFLIFGQTTTLRHGDGQWGVLYPSTFLLVLATLALRVYKKLKHQPLNPVLSQLVRLGIFWSAGGLLPAIIGRDVPHSNRALLALPGFLILAVIGFWLLWEQLVKAQLNQRLHDTYGRNKFLAKFLIGFFFLVESLFVTSYLHDYFTVFAQQSADDFKDGYIEAFRTVLPYEYGREGKPEVEKIVVSDRYGQPYIYALLTRRTSPIMYQSGSLIKYEFKTVDIGDLQRHNAVVVAAAEDELPVEHADYLIYGSDNQVRFKIYVLP